MIRAACRFKDEKMAKAFENKGFLTPGGDRGLIFACKPFLPVLKIQPMMTVSQRMHTLITIIVSRNEQEELLLCRCAYYCDKE